MRTALLALAFSTLPPFAAAQDRTDAERIPVLLISGANNHDWTWTASSLRELLEESGRFDVTVTESPGETLADAEALSEFRAFVLDYNGPRWGEPAESNFMDAVRGGTGVSVVHAANNAFPGWREYEELVGLLWREGTGHGRFHAFDVEVDDRDHPVTDGMPTMRRHPDELYHGLVNVHGVDNRVLGSAWSDPETGGSGRHEPMIVVRMHGEGRVFHTPLGHVWKGVPQSRASHRDPQFRRVVARGTEWAATGAVTLDPVPPNWLTNEERDAAFVLLFDGRDLDGWSSVSGDWRVELAALHTEGSEPAILRHENALPAAFELRFDLALADGARASFRAGDASEPTALEVAEPNRFTRCRIVGEDARVRVTIGDGDPSEFSIDRAGSEWTLRAEAGAASFRSVRVRALRAESSEER